MKGQKTGGRRKGSKNKIKPPQDVIRKVEAEAVANCIATGESPLLICYGSCAIQPSKIRDETKWRARQRLTFTRRSVRKTRNRLTIFTSHWRNWSWDPTNSRREGQADRGPGR